MFSAGQQIGTYILVQRIGRGGFGEVWLAERKSKFVTTKVAVKLPLDEQVDADAIRQEATLWEQASGHPNVLPIIDADEYDGQIVIVSEYTPDGSLEDLLKKNGGSLPIKQAVEMAIGILSGLDFLHSRNIIHRDIKPANILLQGETPRLADFGISRLMRTNSLSVNITGTPYYMAPEAFDRKRNVQTDVWSIGVVLYQMLKGELPFSAENITDLLSIIVREEPQPLPDTVPPQLQKIVSKALAKNPTQRYKAAREMRQDLANFLVRISQKDTELMQPSVATDSFADVETLANPLIHQTDEPKPYVTRQSPQVSNFLQSGKKLSLYLKILIPISVLFLLTGTSIIFKVPIDFRYWISGQETGDNSLKIKRLTVGLSSSRAETVRRILELYESNNRGQVKFLIETLPYDQAYTQFKQDNKYDIVMLDDPWIPEFSDSLIDFKQFSVVPAKSKQSNKLFGETFVNSLASSCEYDNKLLGLPIIGNVQLLLYRKDLFPVSDLPSHNDTRAMDDLANIVLTRGAKLSTDTPFILRFDTENDVVEVFWQILRAYGYQEEYDSNGILIIPRRKAQQTLEWMNRVQPKGRQQKFGRTDIQKRLANGDSLVAFGWSSWIIPMQNPNVAVHQVSQQPLMGSWLLAVPKTSKLQAEAVEVIVTLTTDINNQRFLAEHGGIPVLNQFPLELLQDSNFWRENGSKVMVALDDAVPRPRTPKWREIEISLGRQLRSGNSLTDIQGLIKFTE